MNWKKYLFGIVVLILVLIAFYTIVYPERNFLSGSICALLLLAPFYLFKIFVIVRYPEKGVGIQMGIMAASFFCNGIALWVAVSQNDSSDFIIGFLIAHFSHFLIVVFAS
ncbi:Uncharacterized protein XB16_0688 [Leptospira santarosai]|uniref:Uncharacterized protein n=1 Tax=Leptospira santarosai TaxID=28183 RepID=A0A2P1QQ37_9LEPT|nr:hypothetical protein B2G51_06585 [Leptospira santarosai]AVQ11030.1 Uncharacterized protein XB16_0688 [Leptospira santarosai]